MWSTDRRVHIVVEYDGDGEYSCKWFCDSIYSEDKTYYTNDRTDAYRTAKANIDQYNKEGD